MLNLRPPGKLATLQAWDPQLGRLQQAVAQSGASTVAPCYYVKDDHSKLADKTYLPVNNEFSQRAVAER